MQKIQLYVKIQSFSDTRFNLVYMLYHIWFSLYVRCSGGASIKILGARKMFRGKNVKNAHEAHKNLSFLCPSCQIWANFNTYEIILWGKKIFWRKMPPVAPPLARCTVCQGCMASLSLLAGKDKKHFLNLSSFSYRFSHFSLKILHFLPHFGLLNSSLRKAHPDYATAVCTISC